MDAIILAGGKGSRLWPLTKQLPKCMLLVEGKPIVRHQIELLSKYGLNNIIVSIGYLGEQISSYLRDGREFGVKIAYARESEALGTGGGMKNCEKAVRSSSVLVIYGDILTRLDIGRFVEFHEKHKGVASVVVHKTDHPQDSDLVELAEDKRILKIIGRRQERKSLGCEMAKSSIYILKRKVFDFIPETPNSFEDDVLPFLVQKEKVYAYVTEEKVRDIGTFDRYENASRDSALECKPDVGEEKADHINHRRKVLDK